MLATDGLAASGITKAYGELVANDRIDFDVPAGRVHALLGENGSGKSTLINILAGRVVPDEGTVAVDGRKLQMGMPKESISSGVATVFQDLLLVSSMSGLENIALSLGESATPATRRKVEAAQERSGLEVPLDRDVADLEMPQRQRLELIRALCQEPKYLLLDEPTSFLSPLSIPPFLRWVQQIARSGLGVVFITHRLDEARAIADRVTVLRDGSVVASHEAGALPDNSELATQMIGRSLVQHTSRPTPGTEPALEVSEVSTTASHGGVALSDLSLTVNAGEIVGIAGVDGNGQLELLETLAGFIELDRGSIRFAGRDVSSWDYHSRIESGLCYVSGDRRRYGLVPRFSVAQHFEYVLGEGVRPRIPELVERYGIKPANPGALAERLSGGNQQKMLIGSALERRPEVMVLAHPTQGLDVEAALNVHEMIFDAAAEGMACVVASSDLDELLFLSHRVAVMRRGTIVGEQSAADGYDEQQLAAWFTAGEEALEVGLEGR